MTLTADISPDTQAALLLTAPLLAKHGDDALQPLQPGEYWRFASFLQENGWEPADVLAKDAEDVLRHDRLPIGADRLRLLLGRGFRLSQAVEHWRSRALWVASITDDAYPPRLRRLAKHAPPLIYGCGDATLLNEGGLAVVGSRNVDDNALRYTESIAELVARSKRAVISGGARGVDQAAMRGALEAGGRVLGVLANDLQRAAMRTEHRDVLLDGRLALISPYDPAAGFNVGNAMRRNKMIYAMADAALVVSSDFQQGGTWAGAVEQLDKFRLAPVYVRGATGKAFESLIAKGARPWPGPESPEALRETLAPHPTPQEPSAQASFWL